MDSITFSLDRLPPDVLYAIFYYLDVPDILRVRRVSRRLNGISHSRQVWSNAYRTARLVRPPGPFPWQSAYNLENALARGIRVGRNLHRRSDPTQTEKPAPEIREIRCNEPHNGVNLVFGRFLLVGFQHEIHCYDLNMRATNSRENPSIIYRSPDRPLGWFHCVSAFDVEGRPFACVASLDLKGIIPLFSIFSLNVGEQSGVTLDLLYQFSSCSTFTESINLGPRALVFQNDKGRHVVAMDVHTRTVFLIPSIYTLMKAAGIVDSASMRFLSTSISTSTHVILVSSYYSGDRWRTFFQAFALPSCNAHASTPIPLSPSHGGVILDIEVFDNALLCDTTVDSSTNNILIAIRVHTRATSDSWNCEHGILRLNTDGTITFQPLGFLGRLSRSPHYLSSGSFHGNGRVLEFEPLPGGPDRLISAFDYDLRASGDDDNKTKVTKYPYVVRCSARHRFLDYDPFSARICLARFPRDYHLPTIEIVDFPL